MQTFLARIWRQTPVSFKHFFWQNRIKICSFQSDSASFSFQFRFIFDPELDRNRSKNSFCKQSNMETHADFFSRHLLFHIFNLPSQVSFVLKQFLLVSSQLIYLNFQIFYTFFQKIDPLLQMISVLPFGNIS